MAGSHPPNLQWLEPERSSSLRISGLCERGQKNLPTSNVDGNRGTALLELIALRGLCYFRLYKEQFAITALGIS